MFVTGIAPPDQRPYDTELIALAQIVEAMNQLTAGQRQRALNYINNRYDPEVWD